MARDDGRFYKWFYHEPGMDQALEFFFDRPLSRSELQAHVRARYGIKRLPNGSAVWGTR